MRTVKRINKSLRKSRAENRRKATNDPYGYARMIAGMCAGAMDEAFLGRLTEANKRKSTKVKKW